MKQLFAVLLFVIWSNFLFAQEFQLLGKVANPSSEPLTGVNVLVKETSTGTQTGTDGSYNLSLKKGSYALIFSATGYETVERKVDLFRDITLNITLKKKVEVLQEVVVNAIRVDANSPITFSEISKKEIEKVNLGQDIPVLLNFLPSVVSTTFDGTGIGYTDIRIRGADNSRINVTLNGIPYNDADSQATFWVNLQDFASSVENIQIQ